MQFCGKTDLFIEKNLSDIGRIISVPTAENAGNYKLQETHQ